MPAVDDFEQLLLSAVEHHMQGLLWSAAMRGQVDGPLQSKTVLAGHDLDLQARHARLWDTIADVTRRLADIGVETAVLKGPRSEHRWYDRPGERPSVDVDLLIAPNPCTGRTRPWPPRALPSAAGQLQDSSTAGCVSRSISGSMA
jgi:hypothetical protein